MRMLALIYLALMAVAGAQDPGKEVIGKVRTAVLFGTNGSPESLGDGVVPLREEEVAKLRKVAKLEPYKTFVRLGSVEQDILKGYKSWAQPINGSQALMLTFQPQASIKESRKLRLDILASELESSTVFLPKLILASLQRPRTTAFTHRAA